MYLAKRFYLLTGILWLIIASRVFAELNKSLSGNISKVRQAIVCDPSKSDYRACIHQHFKKDIYTRVTVLQCGETEVAITTSCMDIENGGVYCFNQNLAFLNFSKKWEGIYKNISYTHPSDGAGEPFVTGASCIKVNKKYYVRTSNTNFGNCYGCEWSDFFTNHGEYIGSIPGSYGQTSFLHKHISTTLYDRIMAGERIEQEDGEISVDIYRVRD